MGKGIDLNAHIVENNTERDALDHENGDEQVPVLSLCPVCASHFSDRLIRVDCSY